MGIRFRKSITILPGVKLNISKTGVSATVGVKGAHYTINSKGTGTATLSLPGTGVSYQKKMNLLKVLDVFKKKDNKEKEEKENKIETVQTVVNEEENTEVEVTAEEQDEAVRNYNEYVSAITSLHKEATQEISWENVAGFVIPDGKSDEEIMRYQANITTAKKILDGDLDTYLETVEKHSPFKELAGYGSGFEFILENPKKTEVVFTVNFDDVVPDYVLKKTAKGISQTKLSKTAYYELMQDYVCSCAIRVGRELFALLPLEEIVCHVCDQMLDTSTGNNKEITILSVRFKRDMFKGINYAMIDPSDFVDRFEKSDGFRKTLGYKEVKRLA